MTLVITLPPEVAQRLRERAAREGRDAETIAVATLVEALEREFLNNAEAVQGIQRGLGDFAAGRYRPFNDFVKEQRQDR
ncbi:MAG: hypothetical protein K0Q72_653 [Armatimonadetes bacterium]|jgi:predicted transcriptional regulator|nr:hypothetical protein [Armatimonadota bacterium]